MKHRLLDLLACPGCGTFPLSLKVLASESGPRAEASGTRCQRHCGFEQSAIEENSGVARPCAACYQTEITEAILRCCECKAAFPVIGGIPRFTPDAGSDYPDFFRKHAHEFRGATKESHAGFQSLHKETKRSFGFQWLRYQVTDHQENRDHFYRRTATQAGSLAGKLFFEAGCGMGRYLKVFGDEPGSEVVGLDLSLAVNRAREENRHNPFVHVIQGNIMRLPLRPASFDHAYSIGVLHHTPSTKEAFVSVARLVKPGGKLSVWLYHVWRWPELTGFKGLHASAKGAVTDSIRAVTTRMPLMMLHYMCYLAIPAGWVQAKLWNAPAPIKAVFSPLLLVHLSVHPKAAVRLLDTFDWYSPRYQWKHTVPEVAGWYQELGFVDIDTSGFPVSVRGVRPSAG